jgi:hypothetical protein
LLTGSGPGSTQENSISSRKETLKRLVVSAIYRVNGFG